MKREKREEREEEKGGARGGRGGGHAMAVESPEVVPVSFVLRARLCYNIVHTTCSVMCKLHP
jgi:hypothetical protein